MTKSAKREDVSVEGVRYSIFRDAPAWGELKTAAIGKFSCTSVSEASQQLRFTASGLKEEGFQALIGPMDGNTWHPYRLVTETDGSQPFLMEPTSRPDDYIAFMNAGFKPVAEYVSTRVNTIDAIGPEPIIHETIAIENWDGDSAESFFGEVYDFSLDGFAKNAFYKPITREAFLDLYRPFITFLKREFIFFARRPDGTLAGFLFGIPDYLQGAETKTVILKTYASAERGVGHLLADHFHRTALDLGYDTTIHALIHSDNASLDRSKLHCANVFRKYALLGQEL